MRDAAQVQLYEVEDEEDSPTLGSGVKLVIMVASLGVASIAGFYLHPHLPPLLTESVPELWRAAQGWMTAPILFLLLNVVVGMLYFSSSLLSVTQRGDERSTLRKAAQRKKAPPSMAAVAAVSVPASAGEDKTPDKKPSTGLRARLEKSKTFTRLVRSKSEQIPPVSAKSGAEASGSGAGRLKKAGTFEQTGRSARKTVVVVADPPEDATLPPGGHEEVDQKAEAFISRFYQKVKLQRLDSLLRQQQQRQAGAGN